MLYMDQSPVLRMDEGLFMDDAGSQPKTSRMAKVKLQLDSLDPDGLAGKADAIKTALTGNANYTTPNPSLATLGTDIATAKAKIITQKNAQETAKLGHRRPRGGAGGVAA